MTTLNSRESSTPDINVEGSTGVTSSRRAGNLWTAEARDDMFNRRERGEPWESICQDYPTRSRHAMQQQYSMMKKQRMMAEGTWTNNRRGRKRKVLASATPSVGPRRESGLETTEDEFQSVTPSDLEQDDTEDMVVDEIELGTPAPEANGHSSQSVLDFRRRPSGLSRSATDPAPAPAPRGRGRGRGRVASGYTHADSAHPPLAPKGFTPVNEESKYRHGLPDTATPPAAKRQKSQAETPSGDAPSDVSLPLDDSAVYFSREDVLAFFRTGIANGDRLRKLMDDDAASRDKSFQDAQGRASRRAYEAEERIKETGYRHRSDIRNLELAHQDKMDTLRREYKEEIDQLKNELATARGVDPSTIKVVPKAVEPAPQADAAVKTGAKSAQDQATDSRIEALVTNLMELEGRWNAEKELRKKAEAKAAAAAAGQERAGATLQSAAPDFFHDFSQLETLVMRLHNEYGDLPHNAVAKALSEIRTRCVQCANHFKAHSQSQLGASQSSHDSGTPPAPAPGPQQQQQQQQQQPHRLHQHNQQQQPQQHQPPPPPPPPIQHHIGMTASQGVRPDSHIHQGYDPHGTAAQMGHGSGGTHLAPMQVTGSPSPSPTSAMKPQGIYHSMSHHPSLPTPSEPPFENQPFEPKRSTPVSSIHSLLQQTVSPGMPSQATIIKSPPYEPSRAPVPTSISVQHQYQPGMSHLPSPGHAPQGSPIKQEQDMPNQPPGATHVRQHSSHWA